MHPNQKLLSNSFPPPWAGQLKQGRALARVAQTPLRHNPRLAMSNSPEAQPGSTHPSPPSQPHSDPAQPHFHPAAASSSSPCLPGPGPLHTGAKSEDGAGGVAGWWGGLSATARVAFFTGGYITVAGLAALLFPLQLLALLFPASAIGPGWVRVSATLAVLFGAYYVGAAWDDMEGRKPLRMYQATVLGRVFLSAMFAWLVVSGQGGAGLLLLGAANAAGAWRMNAALSSDGVAWRQNKR